MEAYEPISRSHAMIDLPTEEVIDEGCVGSSARRWMGCRRTASPSFAKN